MSGPAAERKKSEQKLRFREVFVAALIGLMITARLFTETIGIFPRFFNAIDLAIAPILIVLSIPWLILAHRRPVVDASVLNLSLAFTIVWALSWVFNVGGEVHWLGALSLVVGLLSPIAFYLSILNLRISFHFMEVWLARLLNVLLFLNILIGIVQAVQVTTGDEVRGTFGNNQNQFAFFLAVMIAFYLCRWRFGLLHKVEKIMLVPASVLFVLCGFQTLWVMLALSAIMTIGIFARFTFRLIPMITLAVLIPVITLSAVQATYFSLANEALSIRNNFSQLGKVRLIRDLPEVFGMRPWYDLFIGVGPGTFNSRAFRNIAIVPYGGSSAADTDVAAAIVPPFYTSELSSIFIIPYFKRGRFLLSGSNTDGPFTSYVSIPTETGIFGGIAVFGIYAIVMRRLINRFRNGADAYERTFASWAFLCVLMLLGISIVDNYMETTRYTVLVWLAIASSEISSRRPNLARSSLQRAS